MSDSGEASATETMADRPTSSGLGRLALLGVISWAVYVAIAVLSRRFAYGGGYAERPLLLVLACFAVAFGLYLAALRTALAVDDGRRLLLLVVVLAVVFRATLLPSTPIQEIDIYRYMWDGAVCIEGVSPFRYSPDQVRGAVDGSELPDELRRLVQIRDDSPPLATVLDRVHYGEVPTVYPPVSQTVFAATTWLTPSRASLNTRLILFKAAFVAFDLATLGLVIGLLRLAGRHVGWSVAYGWCPLVLKETSNSGHLDAVAVFLSTAAVYVAARTLFALPRPSRGRAVLGAGLAGVLLAAAVGAKLYPVVLVPLLAFSAARRLGAGAVVAAACAFLIVTAIVMRPMLARPADGGHVAISAETVATRVATDAPRDGPAPRDVAPPPVSTAPQDPRRGLRTFLARWEMNDFLFLLIVENVRPLGEVPRNERPWFAVIPESWRRSVVDPVAARWNIDGRSAAFRISRGVTTSLFLLVALVMAARAARAGSAHDWLESVFLTLAWFWLLLPTQNPWYWLWALPLVAFARGRAWLAVSGLVFVYYLRFWFIYQWQGQAVPPTIYHGATFFDFVITWLEFAPWFAWLAIGWLRRR